MTTSFKQIISLKKSLCNELVLVANQLPKSKLQLTLLTIAEHLLAADLQTLIAYSDLQTEYIALQEQIQQLLQSFIDKQVSR